MSPIFAFVTSAHIIFTGIAYDPDGISTAFEKITKNSKEKT
jgi:hypothetical protein